MEQGYFALIVSAILVNNVVLMQFLGICPFLGVSKNLKTALGMCGAVFFVMTLATTVTALINNYILQPGAPLAEGDFTYLQTIAFILVIASLVQLVELTLQRFSQPLYQALGIFLPLITTNCAILGVALLSEQNQYNVGQAALYGAASAVGFALALVMFASLREKLDLAKVPECLQGTAIALITAGILAMAFMGFSGVVE